MLYNAFLDGEELKESFRAEGDTPEEAIPDIIRAMYKDEDTAPDAEYKQAGPRIEVYRDGDALPEMSLEVLPVSENF